MQEIVVKKSDSLKRLDIYLSELLNESRSLISKSIKNDKILVNDCHIRSSYIVKENDIVKIFDLNIPSDIVEENIPLDILYEDDYIIVVNKKSGMVVHPGNGNASHTLVNALMGHTSNLSDCSGSNRCGIVHRIDKDTSGILLVAKTNGAHKILSDDFKYKRVKRKYIALVKGIIEENTGKIVAPIGRSKTDRKKMCITPINSKKAVTTFKVLERYKSSTLVELVLETGRTHQIRVHMEYIHHPLINDPVYGNKHIIDDYGQMLHAGYLEFSHPITKEKMTFEVKPDKHFMDILSKFKN